MKHLLALALVLVLSSSSTVRADDQGDRKGPGDVRGLDELAKIIDLMKEVESRLGEADAGALTRREQRTIVEALEFEEKTKNALDELIKKLEAGGGASGASASGNPPFRGEPPSEDPKRDRQRRDQTAGAKARVDANAKKKEPERPKDGARERAQPTRTARTQPPTPAENERGKAFSRDGETVPWGNLPLKLHEDAEKARRIEVPERWRERIERYREATAN